MSKIDKRVARGVAYLDRVEPGWEAKVTDPVQIDTNHACILGQVFGNFPNHLEDKWPSTQNMFGFFTVGLFRSAPWARRHGFLTIRYTEELNEAWTHVITERNLAKVEVIAEAENLARAAYIKEYEAALSSLMDEKEKV